MDFRKITRTLKNVGYDVVDTSVHGKGQTRFTHCVLEKNGKKYFCKINNTNDVYAPHVNEALASVFKGVPKHIQFLAPLEELQESDHIIDIYPYIDKLPISNESHDFKDFSVPKASIDIFLGRVLQAIAYVETQQVVTMNEVNRQETISEIAVEVLKKLPKDIPYGVEFLQYLLSEGKDLLLEYRLAIDDIQPQNMFWNESDQSLILFDLEHMAPKRRYYDHAKFCSQLWVVCGKSEYAKRFAVLFFASLSPRDRSITFRFFRFNLTLELLVEYIVFKDSETRKKIVEMMRWLRKDLIKLVNSEEVRYEKTR